jgi:gliding motility-associated lipoprotein GldH
LKKFLFFIALILLLFSCSTVDVYEKTESFPDHAWSSKNKLTFQFDITDTAVRYNIYAVIRHLDAYHWNNIWLNVTTIAPGDNANTQQVNLQLGDNVKGWLGAEMDDIVEQRVLLTRTPVQLKQGRYTFTVQQIMREDPLQYVMNAGIRVEKVVQ